MHCNFCHKKTLFKKGQIINPKTVFCTYPAKRAPSASMTATSYITTHSSNISDVQTMDSGVLAGPVQVSGTVTVTGNLVII